MAVLTQHLVLGEPQAVDRAHENAAFAGEVAENLFLEGRLEQVAGADGDAGRETAIEGPAGRVLMNGVDALAFEEEPAHGSPRAFRGDEDDVDVRRRDDAGLVLVDDREAVREVEGLALGKQRLELGPLVLLTGVGEEVLDDGAARGRFLPGEGRLAWGPAIPLRQIPA